MMYRRMGPKDLEKLIEEVKKLEEEKTKKSLVFSQKVATPEELVQRYAPPNLQCL